MDVDTRSLRFFVELAEQLSFTRAAARLFVSQPTLSRRIRALEDELGTPLFERTGREVLLTSAGESLLPAARKLIADWQEAKRAARIAAAAQARVLRVGFQGSGAGPLATQAYAEFMRRCPGSTVEPRQYEWGHDVAALHDGLVDVAFIWLPADTAGLHTEIVAHERRVVLLPIDHHLAGRDDGVKLMELADEPIVTLRRIPREGFDWWVHNPRPDGRRHIGGPECDTVEEMVGLVAAARGICIFPESMGREYDRPGVVWLPVHDLEPLRIALCRRIGGTTQPVADFARVVRRLAAGG